MRAERPSHTLRQFFAGIAEHTFQTQLGVADPPLIDYLSELLLRFVRLDALFRIRSLAGRPLEEVAAMLIEAEQRIGDARREIHRHIGDFTLFWTGVFPEAVRRMRFASCPTRVRSSQNSSYSISTTRSSAPRTLRSYSLSSGVVKRSAPTRVCFRS